MGTRGKVNAIWWNVKLNLQKLVDIHCYVLPTNLQNLTQKNLTEVKIFLKVLVELLFFWNTLYILVRYIDDVGRWSPICEWSWRDDSKRRRRGTDSSSCYWRLNRHDVTSLKMRNRSCRNREPGEADSALGIDWYVERKCTRNKFGVFYGNDSAAWHWKFLLHCHLVTLLSFYMSACMSHFCQPVLCCLRSFDPCLA